MTYRRVDGLGAALTVIAVGLMCLVVAEGADLRRFANALGVSVFALLMWRLTSTWPALTRLERVLGVLLGLSPLVAALASWGLLNAAGPLPDNPWLWLVVAHRAACLVLVVMWTRWLGRRVPGGRQPQSYRTPTRGEGLRRTVPA